MAQGEGEGGGRRCGLQWVGCGVEGRYRWRGVGVAYKEGARVG